MNKEVEYSLNKIAKGTLVLLIGTIIGVALNFLIRIIIVRNLAPSDYGVFSLVIVISTVAITFASFGLQAGIARYISYYRFRKESQKILGIIVSAIELAVIGGILFFCIIFFGSGVLAKIFETPELSLFLKIYSFAIPFAVLSAIFIAVYRGFERVDIRVVFQEVILNSLIIVGLGLIIFIGFSLCSLIYIYLFSTIIVCIALAIYSRKKFIAFLKKHKAVPMRKVLLLFSLPLLARIFSSQVVSWSDVLMLGYFKDTIAVGIYNVALPLANYIALFLNSSSFLYVPLATRLHSANNLFALKRNYIVLTKWISALTLPIFLVLFLFPTAVLKLLYGSGYASASSALSILAVGFLLHSALGPNGSTLLILGRTQFLMYISFFVVFVNIILNLLLIPKYGILGAAIASCIALGLTNIAISIKLYALTGIHPFTNNYLKPLVVSFLSVFVIYFFAQTLLVIKSWMLPVLFVSFMLLYFAALLVTKSFDKEDKLLLLAFENKMGLNLSFIKNILKKFI